ncbi:hypothetical protein BDF14DRAFT_1785855 [Spinellus fusiger]|nr:hypothetical protein BDF14DRAFT_1785855 [Spinellus fusiger]
MADTPFQFDFDDEVFLTERVRPWTQPHHYVAKQETDGWFHTEENEKTLMLEKHGPNQRKHAVEHDYLYKRYDRALAGALGFIRVAETDKACKINNTREMCEMAIHCAVKLKKYALAEQLLDRKQPTIELGSLLLKGRVYPLCINNRRHGDALAALVSYGQQRKLDYAMWRQIAVVLVDDATKYPTTEQDMRGSMAQLALERAHRIMTSSRWCLKEDYVRRRYTKEVDALQEPTHGDPSVFVAWMTTATVSHKAQAGLDIFEWRDIEWVYNEWASFSIIEDIPDKDVFDL